MVGLNCTIHMQRTLDLTNVEVKRESSLMKVHTTESLTRKLRYLSMCQTSHHSSVGASCITLVSVYYRGKTINHV